MPSGRNKRNLFTGQLDTVSRVRGFPFPGMFSCLVLLILSGIFCIGSPVRAESYDWNRWRALPVFHDGRVMPLDTLARQLVKEVCGTERPLVLVDKDLLDKLRQPVDTPQAGEGMGTGLAGESGDNFDLVSAQQATEERNRQMTAIHRMISRLPDDSLPGFLPEEEEEDAEENDGGLSEITSLVQDRQRIARRIEQLIPKGRRYFEAHELLFSWIVEPEIWDYIPFIPTGNTLFQQEVLGTRPYNRVGYRMNRVCRAHLEQSPAYAKILQDMQQGLVPEADSKRKDYERCVRKVEEALAVFDRIVFRPDRGFPEQCALRLQAAMEGTDRHPQSPFRLMVESLDMLCAIDGRNSTQSGVPEIRGMVRDAMMRMHQLYAPFESHPDFASPLDVRPAAMEALFERMLETLDRLGALSAALMQRAWPEGNYPLPPGAEAVDTQWLSGLFDRSFTPERRRYRDHQLLRFHYAVGTLRREVLAAYLALYDNGHAVRIVPSLMEESVLTVDHDMYPVSPWVSLQTLLLARGPMLRRFVDFEFQISSMSSPTPATATPSTSSPTGESAEAPGLLDGLDGSGGIGADLDSGTKNGSPAPPTADSTATENPSDATAVSEDAGTVTTMTGPSVDSPTSLTGSSVTEPTNNSTYRIRRSLVRAYEAYAVNEATTRFKAFGVAMHEFAGAVESTGSRAELVRRLWLDNGKATEELLNKTAYPIRGALAMELWYSRLNPFFWMWVCSALALVFIGLSAFVDRAQKEMIESNPGAAKHSRIEQAMQQELFRRRRLGRHLFRTAALLLGFAIAMTFLGGLMRAWITGWAPVTNMYETVVLMGFAAAIIGLGYTLAPVLKPVFAKAWTWSAFPGFAQMQNVSEFLSPRPPAVESGPGSIETIMDEEILEELGGAPPSYTESVEPDGIDFADPRRCRRITGLWNLALAVPRLLLMVAVLYVTLRLCYGEYVAQEGVFGTLGHLFGMHDPVDLAVVFLTILLIVWFVPRLILAVLLVPVVAFCSDQLAADAGLLPEEEEESLVADRDQSLSSMVEKSETRRVAGSPRSRYGKLWWDLARSEIGGRKLFLAVGALVALLAGLCAASFSEFNPQIRPLTAVLRSNFWLAAHVIAIIVSYAAAGISWGLSMAALGFYIFGHYRQEIHPDGRRVLHVPAPCRMLTPYILQMLRVSVFLLAIGTILGARWADYSWGRFWGWDPKEVWALVTLLYFQVILHGRLARFYGPFGLAVGAALGAIAVVVTWYGANYVFQMGMHAYGGGTNTGGAFAYYVFIAFNALWCFAAALSYYAIRSGTSVGFGGGTETA